MSHRYLDLLHFGGKRTGTGGPETCSSIEPHNVSLGQCGNEPGDSGLPSTTDATIGSGIETSEVFGDA